MGRQVEGRPTGTLALVKRKFTAQATNRLWLADITEHRTGEGKLYLCAQGRVLQPDRRLLDQRPDEVPPGRRRAEQRRRPPRRSGHRLRPAH